MPDFAIVSVKEAQLRTTPGRQRTFMNEYAEYIQKLPQGQAGRLSMAADENPLTIRRRLATAATMLGIHLTIKRSGTDVYFWQEAGAAEQPRSKRRYTRRGSMDEETTGQEQPMREAESTASDNFEEQVTRLESDLPNSTL